MPVLFTDRVDDAAEIFVDARCYLSCLHEEKSIDTAALAILADNDAQGLRPTRAARFLLSGQSAELLLHVHIDKTFGQNGAGNLIEGGVGID